VDGFSSSVAARRGNAEEVEDEEKEKGIEK